MLVKTLQEVLVLLQVIDFVSSEVVQLLLVGVETVEAFLVLAHELFKFVSSFGELLQIFLDSFKVFVKLCIFENGLSFNAQARLIRMLYKCTDLSVHLRSDIFEFRLMIL